MASNHVPSDQVPIQGHNVYTDPSYQNLFSTADRYGAPSWEAQLHQHSALPPSATGQSWHHGYAQQPFNAISQSYGGQTHGLRTASPYQYGQFGQQGPIGSYGQGSNVDPSLGLDPNAIRQQQQSPYQMPMRTQTPQGHTGTVTPQALQHNIPLQHARNTASPYQVPQGTTEFFAQPRVIPPPIVQPVRVPKYDIPKGRRSGGLYVLDQAALAKATKSTAVNKFVTVGSELFHLATNKTALPTYVGRLSLKDLKKAGADSKKLRAKQLASKSQSKALKSAKKPTELKREASDSESSTESSDYDSDSSEDEEEQMPLPASRPDDPDAAVRYDVVKATWHPSSSSPSSDIIRISMRDVWEVLNTIQKRWRADTKAVMEAEEQKKTGELPVLKSRVTSQRDLLKSALEAALESAHPDVLYQLGLIKPFLYMCYQFLANRFRFKDYDGPLSAVLYEVLSRCGTLTSELLEETKVTKALACMKKHANEKHKTFIQQVIDGAAANSKKAKASPPPRAETTENKGAKRPAPEPASRSNIEAPLAKKPKAAEPVANAVKKDPASISGMKSAATQKRPGERPAPTPAPVKTRISQITNKPSGIFASLNAASKKPAPTPAPSTSAKANAVPKAASSAVKEKKSAAAATSKPAFSFAQTMASLQKPKELEKAPVKPEKPLPAETPEEKAKRLRKESRRHLRVAWRPDITLVDIRYFDHGQDDAEMDDMDEHLAGDAADIGKEGQALKQHKELDVDDDDDDLDAEHSNWKQPSYVDFSVVPRDERERNYMPFGGGVKEPSCPEKEANARRDEATLMIIYASTDDVPPSPKEPSRQEQEVSSANAVMNFGAPPDEVLRKYPQPSSLPDLTHLQNIIKQLNGSGQPATLPMAPVENVYTPPPASTGPPNLQDILNSIQPPPPTAIPAPPPMQPGMQYDFAALMANIQAANLGALPPPPPLPISMPPFPFNFPPQQQQNEPTAWPQQMQDAAVYQPQYNQQTNGGTKRQRDDGNNNNDRNQGKRPKKQWPSTPHKVQPCKFFSQGKCNKGDNCTYIHDPNLNFQ